MPIKVLMLLSSRFKSETRGEKETISFSIPTLAYSIGCVEGIAIRRNTGFHTPIDTARENASFMIIQSSMCNFIPRETYQFYVKSIDAKMNYKAFSLGLRVSYSNQHKNLIK